MTVAEMLFDVLSQMTEEQLKHQHPNVRSWYQQRRYGGINSALSDEQIIATYKVNSLDVVRTVRTILADRPSPSETDPRFAPDRVAWLKQYRSDTGCSLAEAEAAYNSRSQHWRSQSPPNVGIRHE